MPVRSQQMNGFSVFSMQIRNQMRATGFKVPDIKSHEWKEHCAAEWNALPHEVQMSFKTHAKDMKQKGRVFKSDRKRSNILEEEYSIGADEVTILENFQRKRVTDVKLLKQNWDWEYADLKKHRQLKFAVVCVQSYGQVTEKRADGFSGSNGNPAVPDLAENSESPRQLCYPAEIAIVEFSIGNGISRQVHAVIPLDARVHVDVSEADHGVESVHGVAKDTPFRITVEPPLPPPHTSRTDASDTSGDHVDHRIDGDEGGQSSHVYGGDGGVETSDGWRELTRLFDDAYSRRRKLFCFANDWMNTLSCLRYIAEHQHTPGATGGFGFASHPGSSLVCVEDLLSAMVLHYELGSNIPSDTIRDLRQLVAKHDTKKVYHQCDYHSELLTAKRDTASGGGLPKEYNCALALAKGAVSFLGQWINAGKIDDALAEVIAMEADRPNPLRTNVAAHSTANSRRRTATVLSVCSTDIDDGDRLSDEDHWQVGSEEVMIGGFGGWPVLNAAVPSTTMDDDLSYLLDRVGMNQDVDVAEIPLTSDDEDPVDVGQFATMASVGRSKVSHELKIVINESDYPPVDVASGVNQKPPRPIVHDSVSSFALPAAIPPRFNNVRQSYGAVQQQPRVSVGDQPGTSGLPPPSQIHVAINTSDDTEVQRQVLKQTASRALGFGRGAPVNKGTRTLGFGSVKFRFKGEPSGGAPWAEMQTRMPSICRGVGRGLSLLNFEEVCQRVMASD